MACYRPLRAWRAKKDLSKIVFTPSSGNHNHALQLPCGQCIGCRLERSRQWAIRLVHEAQLHEKASFLTLTYDPHSLPEGGTLVKAHFQDFMKRLRAKLDYDSPGQKVRFFHCGEYGEKGSRPHYHCALFGEDFASDRKFFKKTPRGDTLYISETLDELWPDGFSTIGELTFESAAYIARYVTKKITGPLKADHYGSRLPEYTTMSRRPGIGAGYYDKFKSDIYPSDQVVMPNRGIMRPPRFYDSRFELTDPDILAELKEKRKQRGMEAAQKDPPTRTRMKARRLHKELTVNSALRRKYEDGQA